MKSMLKIVTDGAADMPADWEEKYQINILPLRVNFGDKTFIQGINFKLEDFYRMVRETRIIPKTSLPSPGQVVDFYRGIAKTGDTILSLHITSRLSGTFATVQAAALELKDEFNIHVFDSGAGSAGLGFMAREARLLAQAGAPIEKILQRMEAIRSRLTIIFTLDNLEFAYLNGRIGALQNALSSLLKVKPIIVLKDGLLTMADKVRTRHRAIDHVLNEVRERLGGRPANVAVVHAADPSIAQEILERVRGMLNVRELIVTDLAIPVAANLGPGTVGIVAYPVEEEKNA
jgi:DegV family protein with EDD domain